MTAEPVTVDSSLNLKMSPKAAQIRKIVVVGGGTAGWMAAAALARLFKNLPQMSVTLIESAEIGTVGVGEATIPPIREFLKFLGIPEKDFMTRTKATFKLAIKFVDWKSEDSAYWHPFGELGPNIENWPLYQHWMKAREMEKACGALMDHSICVKLAEQNKFQFPSPDPHTPLRNSSYAFHLDAAAFAAMLRDYAEAKRVQRIEGKVVEVLQAENSDIACLRLEDERRIDGDFFIDCTGFYGLLIEKTLGSVYEDWSDCLPCDRAYAAPTPRGKALYPLRIRSPRKPAGAGKFRSKPDGQRLCVFQPVHDGIGGARRVPCRARRGADRRTALAQIHRRAAQGSLETELSVARPRLRFSRTARIHEHSSDLHGAVQISRLLS
ncbi:MAG: tryptophan 7-halogenase [Rhodomicrobium sp.]|nr:tryptophan 7-halogenase [Rhodomicrobium sp.]